MAEQKQSPKPGASAGELAPAPRAETMNRGGDYAGCVLRLLEAAADWDRQAFCRPGAAETPSAARAAWGTGHSFFDALETALNGRAPGRPGAAQETRDRAA